MTSMTGGRVTVLDRQGRTVKYLPLQEGVATLGSGTHCDIRVLQAAVNEHHASIVVLENHALLQTVGDSETLVNGQQVTEVVLQHNDVITLGTRSLRWEYNDPTAKRGYKVGQLPIPGRGKSRRRTVGPVPSVCERAMHRIFSLEHRASMPGSTEGKQVAIVQPQRRDAIEPAQKSVSPRPSPANKRPRSTNQMETSMTESDADRSKRKSVKSSPKNQRNPQNTTKASMWIESRKTSPRRSIKTNTLQHSNESVQGNGEQSESAKSSVQSEKSSRNNVQSVQLRASPRKSARVQTPTQLRIANMKRMYSSAKKSTPLRMAVLRKAQSAQKMKVTKIQEPSKIDHTKQAALLLMTGHTPKSKISPTSKRPSYVVKKPSSVRKTPISGRRGRKSKENNTPSTIEVTPKRASTYDSIRKSSRSSGNKSVSILEVTDSETGNSTYQSPRYSERRSSIKSPLLPTPKKSSLKDPKKNTRKTESIKFDLSNLEIPESLDAFTVTDTTKQTFVSDTSEADMTLHYSEVTSSPSPRRPINSRSSRILEKTLGTSLTLSPPHDSIVKERTLIPDSPSSRQSSRGSLMLQKALESSTIYSGSPGSRRTSNTISEASLSEVSAFKTRTLDARSRNNIESYSIVDLVSIDSNDTPTSASLYDSAGSSKITEFGTPPNSAGRKTQSIIDSNFLGSSTPYVEKATRASSRGLSQSYRSSIRSRSSPDISQGSEQSGRSTISTRRSKSLTTPENTQNHIPVNSTRISRRSRSRSRINDSDLLLLDEEESDSSPKTSRRVTKSSQNLATSLITSSPTQYEGTITPEEIHSPQDAGTPMLSIQSLLNSSQSSLRSQSSNQKGRRSYKRKTIGVLSENRKRPSDLKSRSLNISARKTKLRLSKDTSDDSSRTDEGAAPPDNEEVITPKSAFKLIPEAVKNKHSTAKKPLSKRSIIDDLNQSDIVKQLFNSPVKRKLSQSMTEFSRKRLFDDDDDVILAKRPTRNTIALSGKTPDDSVLDQTEAYTPERFVSPINTPSNSPNLSGIKRLFRKDTPDNDLRDVRGVKTLLRTPRPRASDTNDLSNVDGVKAVFAKSPANRLSDVRVKNVFAKSPENDLGRVSGVKSLFQRQNSPRNDLTDVRGVKRMFTQRSPINDLRNVSGVKRLQRKSPKNDLRDVRGVRKMFKNKPQENNSSLDMSGVEELFNTSTQSHHDTKNLFDQLLGKPPLRAVYSNTFSKAKPKAKPRQTKSLHRSIDVITNNVEEWLQAELQKRLNKDKSKKSNSLARELNKIATNTVEGETPIRQSRVRDSTYVRTLIGEQSRKKSASEIYSARRLPFKKRSLTEKSMENKDKSKLPIKKRLVVHSTPVKGWTSVTMNASELGRVSPINSEDFTRESDTVARPVQNKAQQSKISNITLQKSRRTRTVAESSKPSPKVTRGTAKSSSKSSQKGNSRNIKKLQKSLVIKRKPPVMSPEVISPIQRPKRQQNVKTHTPKRTRAKVIKGTVVVQKPSPVVQSNVQGVKASESNNKTTRTRKAAKESPKRPVDAKSSNEQNDISSNKQKTKPTRGRKTIAQQIKEIETKGKAQVNIEILDSKQSNKRQTRRTKINVASPKNKPAVKATRTRKGEDAVKDVPRSDKKEVKQTRNKSKTTEADVVKPNENLQIVKGGRGRAKVKEPNEIPIESTSQIRKGRSRQGKTIESNTNDDLQPKGRKGRAKPADPINEDNLKSTENDTEKQIQTTGRRGRKAAHDTIPVENELKVRKGRKGQKSVAGVGSKKPEDTKTIRNTRTRNNNITDMNVKENAQKQQKAVSFKDSAPKGRKRRAAIDDSVPNKVSRGNKEAKTNKDSNTGTNRSEGDSAPDKGIAGRGRGRKVNAQAEVDTQETTKRKRQTTLQATVPEKEPPSKRTRNTTVVNASVKTRSQRLKDTIQVASKTTSRTRKR